MSYRFKGVLTPVCTPFGPDLAPDADRLVAQCRWLLAQDVGLAIFGTNSEANSMSVEEKIDLMGALVAAGIDPKRMMPGTGCCALTDSVRLTESAVRLGVGGMLMLPPFFYKGMTDDGLFASYAEIIERVASPELAIYLYHIPPVSGVGLSHDLIERLVKTYPGTVVGIKDSGGDWDYTSGLLSREWDDFYVFAGSEAILLGTMQAGGAGCISATANVNPAAIRRLCTEWRKDDAARQQADLNAVRAVFQAHPMIPALKAAIAHWSNDLEWRRTRPPICPLTNTAGSALIATLEAAKFSIADLPRI